MRKSADSGLSRRCLQSGSIPDQDTIRVIRNYIQLGSTPDWQADALRDGLTTLVDTEQSQYPGLLVEPNSTTFQTSKPSVNISQAVESSITHQGNYNYPAEAQQKHEFEKQEAMRYGDSPFTIQQKHEFETHEAIRYGHSVFATRDALPYPCNPIVGPWNYHTGAQSQAWFPPGARYEEVQQPQLGMPTTINDSGLQQQAPSAVKDRADAFKQLVDQANNNLRPKKSRQAKRNKDKEPKEVKIRDLKKFAATFQLKTRVPDDIVPFLTNDFEKQLEIRIRAENYARELSLASNGETSSGNNHRNLSEPSVNLAHGAQPPRSRPRAYAISYPKHPLER